MTFKEAQIRMYELTESYHELQEIENAISKKIEKIQEKRQALWYEHSGLDIMKENFDRQKEKV
jgi:hypothetical protein